VEPDQLGRVNPRTQARRRPGPVPPQHGPPTSEIGSRPRTRTHDRDYARYQAPRPIRRLEASNRSGRCGTDLNRCEHHQAHPGALQAVGSGASGSDLRSEEGWRPPNASSPPRTELTTTGDIGLSHAVVTNMYTTHQRRSEAQSWHRRSVNPLTSHSSRSSCSSSIDHSGSSATFRPRRSTDEPV
jgi:hypothetical protein